jgi:hypothetical protein
MEISAGAGGSYDSHFRLNLEKIFGTNFLDGVDISFLISIIRNCAVRADVRLKALDTIRCLSEYDEYKKALASKELGLMSALFELIHKKEIADSRILECLQTLAKTSVTSKIIMSSPDNDFLESIIDELRIKEAHSEEVRICCSLLCTLVAYRKESVRDIVDRFLYVDALNFIEAAGPDPSKWPRGCNSAEGWSIYILMLCAAQPEVSAEALLEAGIVQVISPVAQHEGLLAMMAAMTLAFLTFTRSAPSRSNSDRDIDCQTSELITNEADKVGPLPASVPSKIVDLFDDALHMRSGEDYSDSTFMMSLVMQAVRNLAIAGKFRDVPSVPTVFRLVKLFQEVVDVFTSDAVAMGNEPTEAGAVDCLDIAVELLYFLLLKQPSPPVESTPSVTS